MFIPFLLLKNIFVTLFYQTPQESIAVSAKRRLEISRLVKFVLKLAFKRMVISPQEIVLHLGSANHAVLVSIEHRERVDERKVLRDLVELSLRDEPVPVVVIVLKHGVDHSVDVLLNRLRIGRSRDRFSPVGERRYPRRRVWRRDGRSRLSRQRKLVDLVLRVAHVERQLEQLDQVAVFLDRRHRVLQIGHALEYYGELGHFSKVNQVVLEFVEMGRVQRDHVL